MDQIKIGSYLKELRREKGMTQAQLAEMVGVSDRSVSRWESGSNLPNLDILIQLADYYKVAISELLDGEKGKNDRNVPLDETILKAADYNNGKNRKTNGRMFNILGVGLITFTIFIIMQLTGFGNTVFKAAVKGALLGFSYGAMCWSVFYARHNLASSFLSLSTSPSAKQ